MSSRIIKHPPHFERPPLNYFSGELPWQRQLREVMRQTNAWQIVNQTAVNRLQENFTRQAGLGAVGMQIAEIQEKWQKRWQFNSPVMEAVSRYHEDMVRRAGIGEAVEQAFEVQNSALRRALDAAATVGFMESIGQQCEESVRHLLPTVPIQTEFVASVAAKMTEAIREGWADTEVVEDAAEYVDEESPEFSLAVQDSVDGLVAWDQATRDQMILGWKVTLYVTQFVLFMWLIGAFEAKSPQEAVQVVLCTLLEGWFVNKVLNPPVNSKEDDY